MESSSYASLALSSEPSLKDNAPKILFDRLVEELPKVTIEDETFYVAEGDTLLDEDQLLLYAGQREAVERVRQAADLAAKGGLGTVSLVATVSPGSPLGSDLTSAGLLGIVQGGKIVRWAPNTVLTYCVLKNTYPDEEKYQTVVANMRSATEDWERTCGVNFQYKSELDNSPTTSPLGVIFTVRYIDALGKFIAAAFFPNDPINRRRVFIDPSYFTTTFNQVGVLRHELGHVLGFRHEHIRSGAPADCPDEDTGRIIDLTKYDPRSVMHYFCGGIGSQELAISDLDREGSQRVYGPPLSDFMLIGAN
jgi:hypothetical protein